MLEEINRLVNALDRLGSPFIECRRPGLRAEELRSAAMECMPWWAPYIDDDVCAWYSWHYGLDPGIASQFGESARDCNIITPDGLTLWSLQEIIDLNWTMDPELDPDTDVSEWAESLGIVFPLGLMCDAHVDYILWKSRPDEEWTVRYHGPMLLNPDMAEGYVEAPTFRTWLNALVDAMEAGRLTIGPYGEVTSIQGHRELTDDQLFPWKG